MLIPKELLNNLKNGNHYIYYVMVSFYNNKKLILLSLMTEHERFEGPSQKWLSVSLNVTDLAPSPFKIRCRNI